MLRNRRGSGRLGCIGSVVLFALIIWFGTKLVPVWMHYQQFQDEMRADARFGITLPDSIIRARLVAQADTMGLPREARHIVIRRRDGRPPTITISAEYTETITLPIFGVKLWHFTPSAEEPL